jgi:streptogramin lyase
MACALEKYAARDPYVDNEGRVWFVECRPQPNRTVGFDPHTLKFFSMTEIG